jgi:hypothetical protein
MASNPVKTMKTTATLVTAGVLALASTSCTTTYDAYGRPVQSVDPGAAVAGAAAAGAVGYAIGRNNRDRDYYYYPHYRGGYYRHRGHWHHH